MELGVTLPVFISRQSEWKDLRMKMLIPDRTGHTTLDTDTGTTIAEMEHQFTALRGQGYMATTMGPEGRETMPSFDPDADTITMTQPLVGG